MHEIIKNIYNTRIISDDQNIEHRVHSYIDKHEYKFLSDFIQSKPDILSTLEVGCGFGISTFCICSMLSDREHAHHTIIDPFQNTPYKDPCTGEIVIDFHGLGISNLKRAGYNFFELIEKTSDLALPELLKDKKGQFDMIFIDGWHSFDQVILDLYYANKLIRIGGYIIVDDCDFCSVGKAVNCLSQYPAYKVESHITRKYNNISTKRKCGNLLKMILPSTLSKFILPKYFYDRYYIQLNPTMIAFKKIDDDNREWHWSGSF